MTYTLSTVQLIDNEIVTETISCYADKLAAMRAAKQAAKTRKDCTTYGPSSLAYVGRTITAVVSW